VVDTREVTADDVDKVGDRSGLANREGLEGMAWREGDLGGACVRFGRAETERASKGRGSSPATCSGGRSRASGKAAVPFSFDGGAPSNRRDLSVKGSNTSRSANARRSGDMLVEETELPGEVESAGSEAVLPAVLALNALGDRNVGEYSRRPETEFEREFMGAVVVVTAAAAVGVGNGPCCPRKGAADPTP
jgi:hypothetical protein